MSYEPMTFTVYETYTGRHTYEPLLCPPVTATSRTC